MVLQNRIKYCARALVAFFLSFTDALCVTFALIPHGLFAYSIALTSFVVLSSYFYWFDLKCMSEFYLHRFWYFCMTPGFVLKEGVVITGGVYHLKGSTIGLRSPRSPISTSVDRKGTQSEDLNDVEELKKQLFDDVGDYPTHQLHLISAAIVVVALVCAMTFAVLNYAGMAVFIYNTLLSNFAFHAGLAYAIANGFAVPSTLILLGMMFQDFFIIALHACRGLPSVLRAFQKRWSTLFTIAPSYHEWIQVLRHVLVLSLTFFISHTSCRLLIYGFKRYCVVISSFSAAPLIPTWLTCCVCFMIALPLLRPLYKIFDAALDSLSHGHWSSYHTWMQKTHNIPMLLWRTIVVFFGLVRVYVQAVTAQTFVRGGHTFLGSSAFTGAFTEFVGLTDRYITQCEPQHGKSKTLEVKHD